MAQDELAPAFQYVLGLGQRPYQILLAIGLLEAADGEVADGEARSPGERSARQAFWDACTVAVVRKRVGTGNQPR